MRLWKSYKLEVSVLKLPGGFGAHETAALFEQVQESISHGGHSIFIVLPTK